MLSIRRNQIESMSDLLNIIQEPQRLTYILYKSNMSYTQLVKYLDDLIRMECVEDRKQPFRSFTITSSGQKCLEMVKKKNRIVIPEAGSEVRTKNLATDTKPL